MNVRPETIKLLEENIGGKIFFISLGNEFLDLTPKISKTKAKINKWNYTKLNTSAQQRKQQQNEKTGRNEWEKILANHISNKGLISKIYKELIQLNSKKNDNNKKNFKYD